MSTARTGLRAGSHRPVSVWILRGLGWTLIAAGAVALLYVAYALWFTGFETERAQQTLQRQWRQQVDTTPAAGQPSAGGGDVDAEAAPTAEIADAPELDDDGDAVARLEFVRPGGGRAPVGPEPLFVVDGVGHQDLTRGPGHYPGTELPGQGGNFAVAGHRTTYSAPFSDLDKLRRGDEIHVTDRTGTEHVYEFADRRIVEPSAGWVLQDDPLGNGEATLTLTTCHPRFSAAQRMVVFAELAG